MLVRVGLPRLGLACLGSTRAALFLDCTRWGPAVLVGLIGLIFFCALSSSFLDGSPSKLTIGRRVGRDPVAAWRTEKPDGDGSESDSDEQGQGRISAEKKSEPGTPREKL